jgi:23S rRNA A2030 N6-methylase RlmJ
MLSLGEQDTLHLFEGKKPELNLLKSHVTFIKRAALISSPMKFPTTNCLLEDSSATLLDQIAAIDSTQRAIILVDPTYENPTRDIASLNSLLKLAATKQNVCVLAWYLRKHLPPVVDASTATAAAAAAEPTLVLPPGSLNIAVVTRANTAIRNFGFVLVNSPPPLETSFRAAAASLGAALDCSFYASTVKPSPPLVHPALEESPKAPETPASVHSEVSASVHSEAPTV